MINVTVKTLDSQNHQFTVDDSFTVEQFKNHIADTVNVPAARQRIIYCGRVLQDNSKLADYDVDGKVVHLVQRAPPNPSNRNVRSLTPPPDLNRARGGFRGFDRVGNTVYMGMGSMSFPQGVMEPQQMFPPRATHTLSSSRLNVARRMLRNAENVIRQLENPSGANEPPPQAEEPLEEEMTPVIEARVIVPSNGDQPIDGNAILNAVQNTIFPAVGNLDPSIGPSTSTGSAEAPGRQQSNTSTPRSSSTENLNADTTPETPRDGSRQSRLRCRGTEMATLLGTLNQLQARFSLFLARYQVFMQDDPQVAPENLQETRQMLNRVSQVLHYLGHAYHSLSDIIINVDQPPPRLLLCRPILIQPPVVQTGIPIQVEAQINLSTDRPGSTPSSTSTASSGATTNSNAPDSTSTVNSSSSSTSVEQPQSQSGGPGITLQPGFVGLPFMPTSSMRVITTPVEIRTLRPNASSRPTNNNNNTSATASSPAQPQSASSAPASTTVGAENNQPPQSEPRQNQSQGPTSGHVVTNNGNLEFFMEVTPEALRGGNLIQSLMQLVGSQLGDTLAQVQGQRSENPIQSNQTSTTQGESQQSQARSTQTNPTTSTHTRSTPRPHVYMTQQAVQGGFDPFLHCYSHHVAQSRPQRIVSVDSQGNRAEPSAARESTGSTANAPNSQTSENTTGGTPPNMPNINAQFEDIIRGLPQTFVDIPNVFNSRQTAELVANAVTQALRQHMFPTGQGAPAAQQQRPPPAHQQRPPQAHQAPPPTQQAPPPAHQGSPLPSAQQAPPPRGAPDGQSPLNQNSWQGRSQQDLFGFIGRLMEHNLPDSLRRGPTLDVYVQSFHPEPYVQGESLIIDLIMLMLRNLRINDLFVISSGNMAPLQRQIDTIQGFFLTEICQNDTTDAGIARATERVMTDFRPIISALESIPARENIDMARTIEGFFRQRVTEIIRLAINSSRSRMEGNSEQNASDLLTTIWRTSRELLALAVHCSANGQEGVESVCVDVMSSTIFNQSNVPNDLHNWTITSSRAALRTFFQNLDIRTSEIEQYVVRNVPQGPSQSETESMQQEPSCEAVVAGNNVEAMDVDFEESPISTEPLLAAPVMVEDTEPLPHVIWGSESWHRHTPENWVPIITRDINKQRRQNSQQPFSDAYLSGMPSKRRKLINNSKPQGSLPQVIAESVRQAVTSTGFTSAAPLDVVAQAASESSEIQTAYRSLLQSTVRNNLRDNEDFNPERYPNTSRYFYDSSPE